MNKRFISSVLAGAMAISALGVSVSAATSDKAIKEAGATTYKISAALAAPEINVTIPSAVAAVVNPYGVSFEMKGTIYGAQGVTSPIYTIKNNTTASAVQVNVTPTIVVPTKTNADTKEKEPAITVVKSAAEITTNEGTKTKSIYAFVRGAISKTNVNEGTDPTDLTLFDPTKNGAADSSLGNGTSTKGLQDIVFTDTTMPDTAESVTTTLMIIPKATKAQTAGQDGAKSDAPATYGYGQFQIGGSITDTTITPWTSADKITLNLILDIGPSVDAVTK